MLPLFSCNFMFWYSISLVVPLYTMYTCMLQNSEVKARPFDDYIFLVIILFQRYCRACAYCYNTSIACTYIVHDSYITTKRDLTDSCNQPVSLWTKTEDKLEYSGYRKVPGHSNTVGRTEPVQAAHLRWSHYVVTLPTIAITGFSDKRPYI